VVNEYACSLTCWMTRRASASSLPHDGLSVVVVDRNHWIQELLCVSVCMRVCVHVFVSVYVL